MDFPNRDATFLPTRRPTFSLPVNDTMETSISVDMCHNIYERLPSSTSLHPTSASPVSLPPVTKPATAPGIPFLSSTLDTNFVTAIAHNGVVGDGFQIVAFPAANERARFLI